jgi:hypothetical protein
MDKRIVESRYLKLWRESYELSELELLLLFLISQFEAFTADLMTFVRVAVKAMDMQYGRLDSTPPPNANIAPKICGYTLNSLSLGHKLMND